MGQHRYTHIWRMWTDELGSLEVNLICNSTRVSYFRPGHSQFPVGGAFCPQLDSLIPGQLPIGFSHGLNFKELDTHPEGDRGLASLGSKTT